MPEPQTDLNDRGGDEPLETAPGPSADAIAELTRERDALQDRVLRTAAEFDNYRKRAERERRDLADYVTGEALGDVLPLLDNFERAMAAPTTDLAAFRTGIELIHKQFVDALRKRGVVPFDTVGKPFDPNLHQAVVREVVPGAKEGEIVEELQRGYMLGERLLRPAMVKVATES
jgi:molecular chaperone GrpE